MFELTVESRFSAAHAIVIAGQREPLHGHDWHITATIAGPALDAEGLLCDFHLVETSLNAISARFHNRNLNDSPPFSTAGGGVNPTAEHVARHIAEELARALAGRLPPSVRITALRITEAPGCAATYRPQP